MAPSKKRGKFKEWITRFFSLKGEVRFAPEGSRRRSRSGSFFTDAQDFTIHNPAMAAIEGNNNTVNYVHHGDYNSAQLVMNLLTLHIIHGAAHDSSARTPPPRCHPETRVKLIARITAWFDGKGQQELVLWITGPAGSGKSAVVQTFAEHLVKTQFLGASVFFSRPNKRNNPYGVFITIAYQLATRIEAYCNFIVERLSRDPELLNGDIQAQFTAFIVVPFVEKKIGAGCKRWGILLDGLDELDGEDAHCEIIHLISNFAHEHPDAPLAWVIASRPETHIFNTFDDDGVRHACWSEHLPIDSTEACKDVERFLRSSFQAIHKKFRHSVPRDWPSNTDFLKLTAAASGLFIYAEVVMQFIRDPNYADPASRLEILLAIINRSNAQPTRENPFVHLDALYHQILSSIAPHLWPTAKRLLGFVNRQGRIFDWFHANELGTLRGMSVLFGLSPHVIYMCVIKCHSTLRVPDWKVAHKQKLTILHASFADYLKDPSRSGEFYLGSDEEIDDDVGSCLLTIWNKCSGDDMGALEPAWHRYCSKWDNGSLSRAITKFHANLFRDVVFCISSMMQHLFKKRAISPIYAQLCDVHMIKLSYYLDVDDVAHIVHTLVTTVVNDIECLRRIAFKDLKFKHLDLKTMSPTRVYYATTGTFSKDQWILTRPRSKTVLETFVSELNFFQKRSPELEVVIFGGVPEGRVAALRYPLNKKPAYRDFMYYIIPYPE